MIERTKEESRKAEERRDEGTKEQKDTRREQRERCEKQREETHQMGQSGQEKKRKIKMRATLRLLLLCPRLLFVAEADNNGRLGGDGMEWMGRDGSQHVQSLAK